MVHGKKILCIIPARGGSKGLERKNIKSLLGKPLIAWSIDHAIKSKIVDKIFVSTDDEEIAKIAVKYGAEVPILRPLHLALDNSSTIDVVLHAIDYFERQNDLFDLVLLLEPTSPLREPDDISNAAENLIKSNKAESIVGVCKVESQHPVFLVGIVNKMLVPYVNKNFEVIRRQDISPLYFFEGSIYISYISSLKKRKNFYHNRTMGYEVPKWKSFEIDDLTDFIIIESIMKAKNEGTELT